MKKLMIMAVAVMALATSYAATTWAYLDTSGANNEETSDIANYSAYYCTADTASSIFGVEGKQEAISAYLAANYVDYRSGIKGMDTMKAYGFDKGVYTFVPQVQGGAMTAGDSYIAIVAYLNDGGNKFRVFESSVDTDGNLSFDPAIGSEDGGGTAGSWTAAAIPEPTTSILMLFGLACLALRRRA